jgi:PQQ-dependent dehydrogenase (methanol/ethanol family)
MSQAIRPSRSKLAAFTAVAFVSLFCLVARGADAPPFRNTEASEDGQWLTPSKDYANTRFSGLKEITRENVKKLKVAWTFSTGISRGHEAAPLVVGSTMYVVTPYPNILYALDLANSGALKWKYEPKPAAQSQGVVCCDVINRGCAFWQNKIVYNTLDSHTVGVDATTGKQLWKTKLGEVNLGETMTMAPLIVDGHALVGNSAADFGVRGWLASIDVNNGNILWRAYSTGPDKDVLIGPDFKPFYDSDKGKDLGVQSWPPGRWQIGGGRVWGWVSYDPELKLVYYGTSNPAPWNADYRIGDNKWTSGLFARDPDSGAAKWFYQFSPHDLWDHDGINENVLLDLKIDGKDRKILIQVQRNGYVYVIDRTNGEVLSATPFVRITTSKGVDLKTGRLIRDEGKRPQLGKVIRDVAPSSPGGKDWCPTAYSPRTGLLYIPHMTLVMDTEPLEVNYVAGTPYVGVESKFYADPVDPGDGSRGSLTAWDPIAKKPAWKLKERFPVWSGVVVTASDIVFYGTMEGWLKVVDAKTGNELWKFKTSSGIVGQPITYRGPDGKQYVAILSGIGGWAGKIVSMDLDPRDPTGGKGFVNAMRDLPDYTTKGGALYVFALP